MSRKKKWAAGRICIAAGLCLIVAAGAMLVSWQVGISSAAEKNETYIETLRTLMPEPQGAAPEERSDNTMAVMPLDGADFAGILEMPRYGSALPVCADWGKPSRYPCVFGGSIYDASLKIGASAQKGQYDFYREISVGDSVCFTDMEGNRYALEVTDLRYAKHADQEALNRREAQLVLFIKNMYAFEYIIVYCDIPN